jgi:hypothetical protein
VLADRSEANAKAAADVISNAGYAVSVATVDVSSREAVQTLVSTANGIGEIRAGDTVWFEPGEPDWHGASPTTAMTHIAIAEMLDGKVVEWLEHVTDEQYGR